MSTDDQDALNALSADAKYQAAVQSIFGQARAAASPTSELWLTLANLTLPTRPERREESLDRRFW